MVPELVARASVLVVDDDHDVRSFIAVFLESRGYDVTTAAGGVEALARLRDWRPDVILLDVSMPELDGWAVLDRIKGVNEIGSDVPVVMVTALGTVPDRLRGGIGGALRYITKPFELDELLGALDDVLAADAQPEPLRRRHVQQSALAHLVRIESGGPETNLADSERRVHLTRLESGAPAAVVPPRRAVEARRRLDTLAPGQLRLLEQLATHDSVTATADDLGMSRSNVYASLRRICRRLDVDGATELLELVRAGDLLDH